MTTEEFIEWAKQQDAAGRADAMGYPWSTWKVAAAQAGAEVPEPAGYALDNAPLYTKDATV